MSSDPVADFLAREQHELAGLDDDSPKTDSQPDDFAGRSDIVGSAMGTTQGDGGAGGTGSFELDTPMSEQAAFQPQADTFTSNGFTDQDLGPPLAEPEPEVAAVPTLSMPAQQEPETIVRWRREEAERLRNKDAEEAEKKEQWCAAAKKELEDWYKNRAEMLSKKQAENRAAETDFIAERDAKAPGKDWERIGRLCEFNPKNAKQTKDVTRFRSLLLHMKQGGGQNTTEE